MRVFFAHPKSMQNEQIDAEVAVVRDLFTKEMGEAVEVVAGRDDYLMHAMSAGGWKNWAKDVATRIDTMSRKPYYDVIVVPGPTIGGATQVIVSHAMHLQKPVFVARMDHEEQTLELERGREVICDDPENYTSGWFIDT